MIYHCSLLSEDLFFRKQSADRFQELLVQTGIVTLSLTGRYYLGFFAKQNSQTPLSALWVYFFAPEFNYYKNNVVPFKIMIPHCFYNTLYLSF